MCLDCVFSICLCTGGRIHPFYRTRVIYVVVCVFSDICLQPGTIGGIEADTPASWPSHDSLNVVDGKCNGEKVPEKVPLSALQNGLCPLIHTFGQLTINGK